MDMDMRVAMRTMMLSGQMGVIAGAMEMRVAQMQSAMDIKVEQMQRTLDERRERVMGRQKGREADLHEALQGRFQEMQARMEAQIALGAQEASYSRVKDRSPRPHVTWQKDTPWLPWREFTN